MASAIAVWASPLTKVGYGVKMNATPLTRRQREVLEWVDWSHDETWGEFCPLHASEIADSLNLSQSTVETVLKTLAAMHYIYPAHMSVPAPKWKITEKGRAALAA